MSRDDRIRTNNARRKNRAKEIFARVVLPGDMLESKFNYIARMVINDVVSEGKLFRDAYDSAVHMFGFDTGEELDLQQALLRHGWCSAYNDAGAASNNNFNLINDYYIAPKERLDV